MQTYPVPEPSPCVEDEALFALARGALQGEALARAELHLQDCADCRAVLAAAMEPVEQRRPARIARYEIADLLGAGAAGVVYRALDPQLRRQVAVKLLRAGPLGALAQSERMLREAQAMARLSDPHVVAVYDAGLHDGNVYLVMECVDGWTLRAWLAAEPRTVPEILRVFGDAGRGLSAAHQKGVVHRDFKPENVLVTRDGRAKVTDFGLARESEPWSSAGAEGEVVGAELYAPTRGLVGTPAYMAPELFEGQPASTASDQFAFAVALFGALFERHPFRAGEGIALAELVTRVRAGTLERPAFATVYHERLFVVLRRALAAAPAERFAGMPELLAALGGARRRPRRALWLAAALGVGGLVALPSFRRAPPMPPSAPVRVAPAAPTPPHAASARLPSAEAPPPAVSAATSKKRSPPASSGDKRRPAKPAEVRYKDWLKDPF